MIERVRGNGCVHFRRYVFVNMHACVYCGYVTRFNKIAIEAMPQLVADKETSDSPHVFF